MQTARMVQAVVLVMIVVAATSCAASKEYTSKLFAPRTPVVKDSQAVATLRFLDLDNLEPDQADWVSTDIIMGRDTVSKTLALDKFAQVYPAKNNKPADSTLKNEPVDNGSPSILVKRKAVQSETKETRLKKETLPAELKAEPEAEETAPVARALNPGEVRNKKSRD